MLLRAKLPALEKRAWGRVGRAAGAIAAALALAGLAGCESAPTSEAGAAAPAGIGAAAAAHPPASAASAASAAASVPVEASAPAVPASAPRPARAESNGYATHWQRPAVRAAGDGVEVLPQGWGRGVRVVVTSSTGIGQVEVRPVRGVWPHRVQVQFQHAPGRPFEALEGLRFQAVNPAHRAGDEVAPPVPDGFSVWQREGRFWVSLPEGWLQDQQTLRIGWVDRYRQ